MQLPASAWLVALITSSSTIPTDIMSARSAPVSDLCAVVAGASVIADDGTFLGVLANSYNAKSIFNEYGQHGSEYAAKSIWNEDGQYGGEYARYSPFNKFDLPPV